MEKNKSIIIKRFASVKYICSTYGVTDAKAWALDQVELMNQLENEEKVHIFLDLSPAKDLEFGKQHCFNGEYLFFRDIYY